MGNYNNVNNNNLRIIDTFLKISESENMDKIVVNNNNNNSYIYIHYRNTASIVYNGNNS